MRVKAAPGIRFPREDKPRNYIEQEEAEVPATAYYLKAIVDGDLVDLDAAKAAPATTAKATGGASNG